MKCPICGHDNRDVARFCQNCGNELTTAGVSAPEYGDNRTLPIQALAAPTSVESQEALPPLAGEVHGSPTVELEVVQDKGAAAGEAPEAEPGPESEVTSTAASEIADGQATEQVTEAGPPSAPEAETDLGDSGAEQPEEDTVECLEAGGGQKPTAGDGQGTTAQEPLPGGGGVAVSVAEEPMATAEGMVRKETRGPGDLDRPPAAEAPVTLEDSEKPPSKVPKQAEEELEAGEAERTDVEDVEMQGLLPWEEEAEPFEALAPGEIVDGRYLVSDVLSKDQDQMLYRVRDLVRCPHCGSTENSADEAFCVSCGASLTQKPVALMLERTTAAGDELVDVLLDAHFEAGGHYYWVWRDLPQTAETGSEKPRTRMLIGKRSHTGQVRELDEDSLFAMFMSRTHESFEDQVALFIVADGMGGHEGGEIASRLAIQTFAGVVMRSVFMPELEGLELSSADICDWMVRAMEQANDQVYLSRQKHENDMGTTMTAALVKDWTLCLAHVGDCRAYRWGTNGLEQLTTDHSIVASMIAAGTAKPDEIYTHPQRSMIYRCIGDVPTIDVDTSTHTLNADDRLIFCCDGLWEMIRNEGIEEVMLREADPQAACDMMVDQANVAGGTDNISVIVVQL